VWAEQAFYVEKQLLKLHNEVQDSPSFSFNDIFIPVTEDD
jgi:hypothetical protein